MTSTTHPSEGWPWWLAWLLPLSLLLLVGFGVRLEWLATDKAAWLLTRSSGTVAYLMLTFSMLWGLLLSSRLVKTAVPPVVSLAVHNITSWVAVGATAFHALILLWDSYYSYTLTDLLIPFTGPYKPGWVGAGIIGLYVMGLTAVSFQFRKQIGQKAWRKLHYLTFAAYILATMHGLMAGTDRAQLSGLFLISAGSVLFLTLYRMLMTVSGK